MVSVFVVIIILIVIGVVVVTLAKSSLKTDIEQDAKKYFGAKQDLSGNLVMEMQGFTISLEHDLAYAARGMSEYVVANIALPKLRDEQLKKCKKVVDISEIDGKLYAIIYASWGYQGERFRRRLEEKLNQLTTCINTDK